MTEAVIERRRTGWDIVFGILLIIGGLVVLGDVVIASVVSVLFIGWMTLAMGIVGIVASLFRIGKPGFWSAILTGGLLTVLGIVFVRNPGLTAVTLTVWNPFTVERLVLGHWTVLVGYGALPWLVLAGRATRRTASPWSRASAG